MKKYFNKTELLLALLLLVLVSRDIPYINILFVNKVWIAYVLLIFLLFSFYVKLQERIYRFLIVFIVFAIVATLLKVNLIAEGIGFLIYLLLWFVVILRIKRL